MLPVRLRRLLLVPRKQSLQPADWRAGSLGEEVGMASLWIPISSGLALIIIVAVKAARSDPPRAMTSCFARSLPMPARQHYWSGNSDRCLVRTRSRPCACVARANRIPSHLPVVLIILRRRTRYLLSHTPVDAFQTDKGAAQPRSPPFRPPADGQIERPRSGFFVNRPAPGPSRQNTVISPQL